MTESRETFETYPYNPDGPSQPMPQDPPPASLQPRASAPPPVTSPPPPPVLGRRVVLGFAAALGVAVVGGLIANSQPDYDPGIIDSEETPFDEDWNEPPVEGPTSAYLDIGNEDTISFDVPTGWEVESEGDYLVISHASGRLVARAPEWSRAIRTDVSREADYLRDGFDPDGAPSVVDESTTYLKVMHQVGTGHFAGEPGSEELVLIMDESAERAIAIWWATVSAEKQVTVEARTMATSIRQLAGAI